MAETGWQDQQLSNPHRDTDKAAKVRSMFAAIAPKYDLNNRLHSFGIDQLWRRSLVRLAKPRAGESVLDVATGTGDVALAFSRAGTRVMGVDFTPELLDRAIAKKTTRGTQPAYVTGDATRLPVTDASFDIASIAFGIRNVDRPERALAEFYRVLKPGGRLVILEFSTPTFPPIRWANRLYCEVIMPRTAAAIARDRVNAYKYLPASVATFLDREALVAEMTKAGFEAVISKPLTFGVAMLYRGDKPA
ncbi:bifunctional demethylmenaquinone methyltransferase/2-methoxy-6-polyprenyl-1,4-benzoquinol methylase UbiE [Mucisphaera sp.]|uniref:bifunctional demethylmenaquinone methyltransferase/2-methoxy-6-polyprenyl-1,4-benzoquinol methylase UbiE n=1 Tax=Mucisphaera sp. TaxID=2913024 RepID=UPI003D0A2498